MIIQQGQVVYSESGETAYAVVAFHPDAWDDVKVQIVIYNGKKSRNIIRHHVGGYLAKTLRQKIFSKKPPRRSR